MSSVEEDDDEDDEEEEPVAVSPVHKPGQPGIKGMAYDRKTTSCVRRAATMSEQRMRRSAEVSLASSQDPAMNFTGPADQLRQLLRRKFGSCIQGWRQVLDVQKSNHVGLADFVKVLRSLGFAGDVSAAFAEFGGAVRKQVTLADVDAKAAQVVGDFYRAYRDNIGPIKGLVAGTDCLSVRQPLFLKRCESFNEDVDLDIDLKEAFKYLQTNGAVSEEDCSWLEFFIERRPPTPQQSEKQRATEELVEDLKARAKADVRKREVDRFREALCHKYGSVIAGWHELLDQDSTGEVTWEDFEESAKELGFKGDLDHIWEELVREEEQTLVLNRLEPNSEEARKNFIKCCIARFGSVQNAFRELHSSSKPLVSQEDFNRLCLDIVLEKNRRLLWELIDKKGVGMASLEEIDEEAATQVFGQRKLDTAKDQLDGMEPASKARKSLARRAAEQCAVTRRPRDALPSHRKALVALLEERFGSPVRAWALALDPKAKGKLKRKDFMTGAAAVGYTGNVAALWEELGLKAKASMRFKDLAPEVIEEIKAFKTTIGKKIIGLIQSAESTAPGKNKKAGVPVDNDELNKVLDSAMFEGDREKLIAHLDPSGAGAISTRTLRCIHEQKSEEKAVPLFLKKFHEVRIAQMDARIQEKMVPKIKDTLERVGWLFKTARDDREAKLEGENMKTKFLADLVSKCGSLAKAWKLALDVENDTNIEHVEKLIKGLKRAGLQEEGDQDTRKKAEALFELLAPESTGLITYDVLDPITPVLMETFMDKCEERFGSLQEAFEHIDPAGTGMCTKQDFVGLCHEIKLADGKHRLVDWIDPAGSGTLSLAIVDPGVLKEAQRAIKGRKRLQQQRIDEAQGNGRGHMLGKPKELGISCGVEANAEERELKPGQKSVMELKRRLIRKHGTVVRAWRVVFGGTMFKCGPSDFQRLFEEVKLNSERVEAAWAGLCGDNPKARLTLELFEPGIQKDWAELKQRIIERYGSFQNAFHEVDNDDSYAVDYQGFLSLCYESQFRGNERRVFEYLDTKDSKIVQFSEIDPKAVEEVKTRRDKEARARRVIAAGTAKKLRASAAKFLPPPSPKDDAPEPPAADGDDEANSAGDGDGESRPSSPLKPSSPPKPPRPKSPTAGATLLPGASPTPAPGPPRPAKVFRDQLRRRFDGNLVKAWRVMDPHGLTVLKRSEFVQAVGFTGYAGNPQVLWDDLTDEKQVSMVSMREIDPKVWFHIASWRRSIRQTYNSLEALFAETSDLENKPVKRYDEQEFYKICAKVKARQPWDRLWKQFEVKSGGSIAWEDCKWLEEQWAWEGTKEQPIRQAKPPPKTSWAGQLPGSPSRTAGLGHLCFEMRPRQVALKKSSSLPSLKMSIRATWNERHYVNDHLGNRDMTMIHLVTKVNTEEQDKTKLRVAKKLSEVSTMDWMQDWVNRPVEPDEDESEEGGMEGDED